MYLPAIKNGIILRLNFCPGADTMVAGTAPLPDEIIWPNMENSYQTQTFANFWHVLEVIMLVCVLDVTLLFVLIEVVQDLLLIGNYKKKTNF